MTIERKTTFLGRVIEKEILIPPTRVILDTLGPSVMFGRIRTLDVLSDNSVILQTIYPYIEGDETQTLIGPQINDQKIKRGLIVSHEYSWRPNQPEV